MLDGGGRVFCRRRKTSIGCKGCGKGRSGQEIVQAMNYVTTVNAVCLFNDVSCFTREVFLRYYGLRVCVSLLAR